jgi:hypothetical protein
MKVFLANIASILRRLAGLEQTVAEIPAVVVKYGPNVNDYIVGIDDQALAIDYALNADKLYSQSDNAYLTYEDILAANGTPTQLEYTYFDENMQSDVTATFFLDSSTGFWSGGPNIVDFADFSNNTYQIIDPNYGTSYGINDNHMGVGTDSAWQLISQTGWQLYMDDANARWTSDGEQYGYPTVSSANSLKYNNLGSGMATLVFDETNGFWKNDLSGFETVESAHWAQKIRDDAVNPEDGSSILYGISNGYMSGVTVTNSDYAHGLYNTWWDEYSQQEQYSEITMGEHGMWQTMQFSTSDLICNVCMIRNMSDSSKESYIETDGEGDMWFYAGNQAYHFGDETYNQRLYAGNIALNFMATSYEDSQTLNISDNALWNDHGTVKIGERQTPSVSVEVITANGQIDVHTEVAVINKSTAINVDLPADPYVGKKLVVKNVGAGTATIYAISGSEMCRIDGAATTTLAQNASATLVCWDTDKWTKI